MIGQMRDRIKIKAPTDTEVAGGGAISVYDIVLDDWANVESLSSRRVMQDSQININEGLSFIIRYRTSFTPDKTMLIEFEGRDYTIDGVQETRGKKKSDQRKRYWSITALGDGQPIQTT